MNAYNAGIAQWKLTQYITDLLLVVTTDPARFSRMVGGNGQSLGSEAKWLQNATKNAEILGDQSALTWLAMWPDVYSRIELTGKEAI